MHCAEGRNILPAPSTLTSRCACTHGLWVSTGCLLQILPFGAQHLLLLSRIWTERNFRVAGSMSYLRVRLPMVSFMLLEDRMARYAMQWDRLPEMRCLLQTMKALDLLYHDVGEVGLYWRMRAQGLCDSRILRQEDIAQAMNTPPKGTRAQARGKAICEVWRDSSARASWMGVTAARGVMPLNDPFGCEGQWTAPARAEPKMTP